MDRLPTLISLLGFAALAAGCADEPAAAPAASSRFEGVTAEASGVDAVLADICDVRHGAESAPRFSFPATVGTPELHSGGWTWVNYWATWCKPCVEELPMLIEALADGPIRLAMVSADREEAPLSAFRAEHGAGISSVRLEDPTALPTSLSAFGFTSPPSLPVHVLVDPHGGVRCVRAGGVEKRHVDAVREALGATADAPRIR